MEIVIIDNKSNQIFSCIKESIKTNGYVIIDDWGSYKLYKKDTWFKGFKSPIMWFFYNNCTIDIEVYNKYQYDEYIDIINKVFKNIKDLNIIIEKHYKDCNQN